MTARTILENYETITLDGMTSIKLMNRMDVKYVTSLAKMDSLLKAASRDYYVLVTGNNPVASYDTIYFDTPQRDMYLKHHNGRAVRQKIRTRQYVNTGETFLEIKMKDNHRRTKKKRMALDTAVFTAPESCPGTDIFIAQKTDYNIGDLSAALQTRFNRITLVNKALTERITIDSSLHFHNFRSGNEVSLGNAVIMERKYDSTSPSKFPALTREFGIKEQKMSKYCIGTAMTDPSIKQNNFKLKIRTLQKYVPVTKHNTTI